MNEPIDDFRGPYRWLSNFGLDPVFWQGITFPTSEHAYQWAKTADPAWQLAIVQAATPRQAKGLGGACPRRPGFDDMRVAVMTEIQCAKYTVGRDISVKLLETGDRPLIEGNTWNDRFWGVCNGVGENWLGRILMSVRTELRRIS